MAFFLGYQISSIFGEHCLYQTLLVSCLRLEIFDTDVEVIHDSEFILKEKEMLCQEKRMSLSGVEWWLNILQNNCRAIVKIAPKKP